MKKFIKIKYSYRQIIYRAFGDSSDFCVACSHLHLPANPEPAIALGPAVFDLDDDIHLVGVGVGTFEAALFGGVIDEDERGARVGFTQGFHVFDLQSGLADGVNEHKIELTGVFWHPVGHKKAGVCGFEAIDFLLEGVSEAFLDGAVEYFAVVLRQIVRKIEAQGGFPGFGQSKYHCRKAHRRVTDELPVFSLQPDGFKGHAEEGSGRDHLRLMMGMLMRA